MNVRAIVLSSILGTVLLPSAHSSPSDEVSRRGRVPNNVAAGIAADLFPEQCGSGGHGCGISYGPEYCPLQFAIVFPKGADSKAEPSVAWVTVDPRGKVVEVSSVPSKECRKGNGIAS